MLRHGNLFLFAGANLLLQATFLVCQFLVLRFIPPEQMGVWAFVALLEGYFLITQLGVINAMNREYPYFAGLNQTDKAVAVARTAQAYALCNGTFLGLVFLVLSFVLGATRGWEWRVAMLAAAITAPMDQYTSYLEGTYRSGNEFKRLSFIRLVQCVVAIVTMYLPWRFGFTGFCVRAVLLVAAPAGLGHVFRPLRYGPGFDRGSVRLLVATGWRLFLWSYLVRTAQSFPRLVLGTFSGTTALGLFVPVSVVVQGMNSVATSLSGYLYPRLTRRFAQNQPDVGRVALKAAFLAILALAVPAAIGALVLPWIVPRVLPQYAPSIRACQVALAAGLLECMIVATIAFGAAKAWRRMFGYVTSGLVVRAGGAFGGYYSMPQDRVLGVACGMLVASAVMAVVTVVTASGVGRKAAASEDEAAANLEAAAAATSITTPASPADA
jgi:O-antigen/teichoic acid export membrane protein